MWGLCGYMLTPTSKSMSKKYKHHNVFIIFQQTLYFPRVVGYSVNQLCCTAPIWLENVFLI